MASFSLTKAFGTVAGFNALSRVLGFFREVLTALVLGASPLADAYFIALRIPNLLRSIFAEGAFTSAFVPVFSTSFKGKPESIRQIFGSVFGWLFLVTTIVSILGIIFSSQVINIFAPGLNQDNADAIKLLQIMMPYISLVSLVVLANGALNTVGVFGSAAFAQVLMNITLIFGGIIAYYVKSWNPAYVLAITFTIGGLIQVLVQVPSLKKKGIFAAPNLQVTNEVKQVANLMLPAMIGAGAYQLFIFAQSIIASVLEPGSISWLAYSDRLIQMPLGIVSISLAQVLLPKLSGATDSDDFRKNLFKSLKINFFIIIPVVLVLFFFGSDLALLVFKRGHFSDKDSEITGAIIKISSLGIIFTSSQTLLVRAFHARKDTKTPALISICSLFFFVIFACMFMGHSVRGDGTMVDIINYCVDNIGIYNYGVYGLAIASVIASAFSFIFTLFLVRKVV